MRVNAKSGFLSVPRPSTVSLAVFALPCCESIVKTRVTGGGKTFTLVLMGDTYIAVLYNLWPGNVW